MKIYAPDDDRAIILGISQRKSAREIGEEIGRSRASVIGRAYRIGCPWNLSKQEKSRYSRISGRWRAR